MNQSFVCFASDVVDRHSAMHWQYESDFISIFDTAHMCCSRQRACAVHRLVFQCSGYALSVGKQSDCIVVIMAVPPTGSLRETLCLSLEINFIFNGQHPPFNGSEAVK